MLGNRVNSERNFKARALMSPVGAGVAEPVDDELNDLLRLESCSEDGFYNITVNTILFVRHYIAIQLRDR